MKKIERLLRDILVIIFLWLNYETSNTAFSGGSLSLAKLICLGGLLLSAFLAIASPLEGLIISSKINILDILRGKVIYSILIGVFGAYMFFMLNSAVAIVSASIILLNAILLFVLWLRYETSI